MTNLEKYDQTFCDALGIKRTDFGEDLEYQGVQAWDSVGHMELIAQLEDAFDITLDTDDIVDFSSYKIGKEILKKYDIVVE